MLPTAREIFIHHPLVFKYYNAGMYAVQVELRQNVNGDLYFKVNVRNRVSNFIDKFCQEYSCNCKTIDNLNDHIKAIKHYANEHKKELRRKANEID